jgi:hypothetical protein
MKDHDAGLIGKEAADEIWAHVPELSQLLHRVVPFKGPLLHNKTASQ